MSTQKTKHTIYAIKILGAIQHLIEENSIDAKELTDEDNLKHFLHAISNTVPNHIYNKLTGDDKNNLEFNHVANALVFEFCINEKG